MHWTNSSAFLTRAVFLGAAAALVMLAGCARGSSAGASGAAAPKSTAGMNAQGEVVDSKKVESGSGERVKGINNWEGEITGKPAPGSKFTQLKIGMGYREVIDIVGQPSDQGAYVTGKAWIPFYFGSDRYRFELLYKGVGRLIFAGAAGGGGGNLIWVIHNANEVAYR